MTGILIHRHKQRRRSHEDYDDRDGDGAHHILGLCVCRRRGHSWRRRRWGGWEGRRLCWCEGRRSPRCGRSRRGCTQHNTGHGNRHHIRRTCYSWLKCKRPLQWGIVDDPWRGLLIELADASGVMPARTPHHFAGCHGAVAPGQKPLTVSACRAAVTKPPGMRSPPASRTTCKNSREVRVLSCTRDPQKEADRCCRTDSTLLK